MKHRTRIHSPSEAPLSSRALFDLSLFSTFLFVFSALVAQFLLSLYTAMLLKAYSITFRYSLFAINFLSESSTNWTADQIYFVFGSGPLLLSSLGLFLMFLLKRSKHISWKTRLAITWMAFLMANALPCSLIAGVFFYEGFGMAFQWLVGSFPVRGIIALLVLLAMILFSRVWWRMFLKASYSADFLDHGDHQKTFIKNIYFKPWIYGFIILMLFNWPFDNFFWRTFLICMGFMSVALFDRKTRMHRKPHIMKSDKKIFATSYQYVYFILAIFLVWMVDNIVMSF